MMGIREAAMSKPEAPAPAPAPINSGNNSSLFDYDNYPTAQSIKQPTSQSAIEIRLTVTNEEVGPIADETSLKYDWNKAQNKAEEIAYDRIQELLGQGFESKYKINFDTYDDGEQYEVSIVLEPTK